MKNRELFNIWLTKRGYFAFYGGLCVLIVIFVVLYLPPVCRDSKVTIDMDSQLKLLCKVKNREQRSRIIAEIVRDNKKKEVFSAAVRFLIDKKYQCGTYEIDNPDPLYVKATVVREILENLGYDKQVGTNMLARLFDSKPSLDVGATVEFLKFYPMHRDALVVTLARIAKDSVRNIAIRTEAFYSLTELDVETAISVLTKILQSPYLKYKMACTVMTWLGSACGRGKIKDTKEIEQVLIKLLNDESLKSVWIFALKPLAIIKSEAARPTLLRLLNLPCEDEGNAQIVSVVARALSEVGILSDIPILMKRIWLVNWPELHYWFFFATYRISPRITLALAIRALRSHDSEMKKEATHFLLKFVNFEELLHVSGKYRAADLRRIIKWMKENYRYLYDCEKESGLSLWIKMSKKAKETDSYTDSKTGEILQGKKAAELEEKESEIIKLGEELLKKLEEKKQKEESKKTGKK